MAIYQSAEELVGRTPLVRLGRFAADRGLRAQILGKLEGWNPAGSVKDRVALEMLRQAEEQGVISPGGVILEPTSGNTGIGLAAFGTARGYRVIIVMPETMSAERQKLIRAYGAELVLTPGSAGMAGAVEKARQLQKEIPGSWIAGQFENPSNPMAHFRTTGPELWADTGGRLDILVAGVGTGGTIIRSGWWRWSLPHLPCWREERPGPTACRDWGPTSSPGCWIPGCMTRWYPLRKRRPMKRSGTWPGWKGFWWGFPPARRWPPQPRWQAGRRTGARCWL